MVLLSEVLSNGIISVHHPVLASVASHPQGYLVGGIIALLIMGYLVYSLIRPEKF